MLRLDLGIHMILLAPKGQLWTKAELETLERGIEATIQDANTLALGLDLRALRKLDDASIGILLQAQARLSGHDKRVVLIRPSTTVLDSLSIDGLSSALPAYRGLAEAKAKLSLSARALVCH